MKLRLKAVVFQGNAAQKQQRLCCPKTLRAKMYLASSEVNERGFRCHVSHQKNSQIAAREITVYKMSTKCCFWQNM